MLVLETPDVLVLETPDVLVLETPETDGVYTLVAIPTATESSLYAVIVESSVGIEGSVERNSVVEGSVPIEGYVVVESSVVLEESIVVEGSCTHAVLITIVSIPRSKFSKSARRPLRGLQDA